MMNDFSVRIIDDLCPSHVLIYHFVMHRVEFKLVKVKDSCYYSLTVACMCWLQLGGWGGRVEETVHL